MIKILNRKIFNDKEKALRTNEINYNIAVIKNDIAAMLKARSNMAILNDDMEEVEDLLMEIHNYKCSEILEASEVDYDSLGTLTRKKIEEIMQVKDIILEYLEEKCPDYAREYICAY